MVEQILTLDAPLIVVTAVGFGIPLYHSIRSLHGRMIRHHFYLLCFMVTLIWLLLMIVGQAVADFGDVVLTGLFWVLEISVLGGMLFTLEVIERSSSL